MRRIQALNTCTMDALYEARRQMDSILTHGDTPDHVRHAAAVLMNFYGAEIDVRMMERVEGK